MRNHTRWHQQSLAESQCSLLTGKFTVGEKVVEAMIDVQITIYSKGRVSKIRKSISRKCNCNKMRAPVLETICHGGEKHSLSNQIVLGPLTSFALKQSEFLPSQVTATQPKQHTKKGALAGYGRAPQSVLCMGYSCAGIASRKPQGRGGVGQGWHLKNTLVHSAFLGVASLACFSIIHLLSHVAIDPSWALTLTSHGQRKKGAHFPRPQVEKSQGYSDWPGLHHVFVLPPIPMTRRLGISVGLVWVGETIRCSHKDGAI